MDDRIVGIYYSGPYFNQDLAFAAYALYFDEIHLVTIGDFSRDPTAYLRSLPDEFSIGAIGKTDRESMERTANFYRFAHQFRELIGEVLFYEPHFLTRGITRLFDKFRSGEGVKAEELIGTLLGQDEDSLELVEFLKQHPECKDDFVLRSAPTALSLAKKNDWALIGDNPKYPIPYLAETLRDVPQLSSVLAEECLKLSLPAPATIFPEDILEARERLRNELTAFRSVMYRTSRQLRSVVEKAEPRELRAEAKFLVQTEVMPTLNEIKQRIELEKGKLWRRIFGKVLSWIPMVANGFLNPSPENIFKALSKLGADGKELMLAEHEVAALRSPGICYLIKVEKELRSLSNERTD